MLRPLWPPPCSPRATKPTTRSTPRCLKHPTLHGFAITLTGADEADTRAFFDTSAKAEAWESSLSSLSVFAFDNSGALIIRRDFTSSELASKSATFALPKSAAGTECSFYAVANYDASSAKTRRSPYGPRGKVGCRL